MTGRERRCGWIDLVALRYAIMIDGVTKLIMMKSDVLDGFDEIKACVAYEIDGKRVEDFPTPSTAWMSKFGLRHPSRMEDRHDGHEERTGIPQGIQRLCGIPRKELQTPIAVVSIGPDREQTIVRDSF